MLPRGTPIFAQVKCIFVYLLRLPRMDFDSGTDEAEDGVMSKSSRMCTHMRSIQTKDFVRKLGCPLCTPIRYV